MTITQIEIDCTKGKSFNYIEHKFDSTSDKSTLIELVKKGQELAEIVNPTLARDSEQRRTPNVKIKDCIGGMIAEYCWRSWLNSYLKSKGIKAQVNETDLEDVGKQIDLEIQYESGKTKTIEVRSSFAYAGVGAAICRNFRILGPYYNKVKKIEYLKDYHVMAIYSFHKDNLLDELRSGAFKAYLTGGATKYLLQTSPHVSDEELTPMDEISFSSSRATYRVIYPIVNGLDTIAISEAISKMI
ncbi:MAG: hypothetical protein MPEBLZ_01671 [Candidatus Methanoperedens nitroreducens]|uniref:Uncharacterized protein n=1 Tax=Candidatus Methanoperedens nitratireducens TaxID=1392998 RepID=A0A0P7ZG43_9EURY|nr:MAG: hypothetical protein MPEBLZ_01671 [Candidatus Methanoperedens sp. BLZ1]